MLKSCGLVAICLLAFCSLHARAATYNVGLGQSVDLQDGDVALVRQGGAVSAITCNGGVQSLPPRQQFEISREVRFSDIFQNANEAIRQIQCGQYTAEPQIKQALADALNYARETCFNAGYQTCAQPMVTDEQYSYQMGGFPGNYTCRVLARIIGTNPR